MEAGRANANKKFRLTSFQTVILGFLALIITGTVLLMLPVSAKSGEWTSPGDALFTAAWWSLFGQAVILVLIQIGGLGIVSVTAFIASASGRRISLMHRSMLQESLSAHQAGGVVRMTGFIFRVAFAAEIIGALALMPSFCARYGFYGVWMAFFHSVSAFCNAGFDVTGTHTGEFSSFTAFAADPFVTVPVMLLIIMGGIGYRMVKVD